MSFIEKDISNSSTVANAIWLESTSKSPMNHLAGYLNGLSLFAQKNNVDIPVQQIKEELDSNYI